MNFSCSYFLKTLNSFLLKPLRIASNNRDSLAALVAPICNLFSAEARKFYRWNCITVALNLALTSLVLNSLSGYDIISILDPHVLFSFGINDELLPQNIMGVGSLVVIASRDAIQ